MKRKTDVAGQPGLDPTLPNVSLKVNGETYFLSFDFNAVVQVQAETGMNLMAAGVEMFSNPLICRAVLWASLLSARPEITLEQAGKLITRSNYFEVIDKLGVAWKASLPEPEEGKATGE